MDFSTKGRFHKPRPACLSTEYASDARPRPPREEPRDLQGGRKRAAQIKFPSGTDWRYNPPFSP